MNTKRVFNQLTQRTHMPFYNDGMLIFCTNESVASRKVNRQLRVAGPTEADYRPWKLAVAEWTNKTITPIDVGMPDDAILCNPTFHQDGKELHVSFVAGVPFEDGVSYHLYEMTGDSWQNLTSPQQVGNEAAKTGFVSPVYYCLGGEHQLTLLDRRNHDRFRLMTSLREISRAIYDPERPPRLLITGINVWGEYVTLMFDMETQEVTEIHGPAPAYKACLIGDRILFSYRESDEVEDYQIHIAPATFEPSSETVEVVKI